jgi:hypothetical protein
VSAAQPNGLRRLTQLMQAGRVRVEPFHSTEEDGATVEGVALVVVTPARELAGEPEWGRPCCSRCQDVTDAELRTIRAVQLGREIGPYLISPRGVVTCRATGEQRLLHVTLNDRHLLQALLAAYPLAAPSAALLDGFRGGDADLHVIHTRVSHFRERLKAQAAPFGLETISGYGYRLVLVERAP